MTETVWITRTLPAAHKSAEAWSLAGCAAAIAPLLVITPPETMPPLPEKEAMLIFTSGNGIAAFTKLTDERRWPVVTVGDETAKRARALGFISVWSADGTSEDVTKLVIDKFPKTQTVIHCAGKHVRGTIVEDLERAGFTARRDLYYQSEPVSKIPNLDLSKLTYIALYSPLAAKTLANFAPNLSSVVTLSISPATDAALGPINCKARRIAKRPTEEAMLDLIDPQRTG